MIAQTKMIGTIVLSGLLALANAQFPPTPKGLTILRSKFNENVTISFKEVRGPTASAIFPIPPR